MIRRLALPPSFAVLALIALAFVVPGLAGHDPWKTFDAITIEIVHQMQLGGDWLVPHVAGEPWLEDPPLYAWVALGFAKALMWAVQFHEAVRLASGAFLLLAFGLLYLAARQWAEDEQRRAAAASAVLLLIGSVGLIVHAHEAVSDLASLAAVCGAFAALPLAARRPLVAGGAFGAALGAAFLSTGFVVPLALAAAVLLAHLVCDEWRTRRGAAFLAVAALVALAIAGSWPLALWQRSPALFGEWWAQTARLQRRISAQPGLLRGARELVRVAGVAARGLGGVGPAPALARGAPVRAAGGGAVLARRHFARRPGPGRERDRAARAAGAARRPRHRAAAPRRVGRARLVRRHDLRLLRRPGVARLRGDDDRRAAAHRAQLRQAGAGLQRAFPPAVVRGRGSRPRSAGSTWCCSPRPRPPAA